MKTSLTKLATRSAFAAGGVIALVGVAHMPVARGILRKVGGCPVGEASAAGVENARMVGVRATRGTETAPSRPALGFVLDVTTKAEVGAWAHAHRIACREAVEGMKLTCKDVPADALGARPLTAGSVGEIVFGFRPEGARLVNVRALTHGLPPDDAAVRATALGEHLVASLGTPSSGSPGADATRLAKGGYATMHLSFRFADYTSEVTATSIDGRGVLLREHYISGVD